MIASVLSNENNMNELKNQVISFIKLSMKSFYLTNETVLLKILIAQIELLKNYDRFSSYKQLTPNFIEESSTNFSTQLYQLYTSQSVNFENFLKLFHALKTIFLEYLYKNKNDIPLYECAMILMNQTELNLIKHHAQINCSDFTKQLESTLQNALSDRDLYITIFESLPLPTLVLDREYKLQNLNFRAIEYLSDIPELSIQSKTESKNTFHDMTSAFKEFDFISYFNVDIKSFEKDSTCKHKHFISVINENSKKLKYNLEFMKVFNSTGNYNGVIITFTILSELIEW